jgi:hypothetical protein
LRCGAWCHDRCTCRGAARFGAVAGARRRRSPTPTDSARCG